MSNIILILIGLGLGIFLYDQYLRYVNNYILDKHYKTPLLALEKRGLNIYKFLYRQGDFVMLNFDLNSQVFIDMKKRTVAVYENDMFIFSTHKKFIKDFERFYFALLVKFHKEIFEEVIKINNVTYSKNMFNLNIIDTLETTLQKKDIVQPDILTVDDILDKINENGINSLTEEERNYLYNQNKSEE